jgi:hypothetical protein
MVEYRRRTPPPPPPSGRPPPPRPSEPEEEPPSGGGFTRQQPPYASPWRRPIGPPARFEEEERPARGGYGGGAGLRPLHEILFPPGEQGGEEMFQYRPGRPRTDIPLPGIRREAAAPSGPTRPARRSGDPPVVDPRNWFDVERVWATIREQRKHPQFPKGVPVSMLRVTPPRPDEMSRGADLVRFFRIPQEEVARFPGQTLWTGLLHPFLDELAYAFNYSKPTDIPGEIAFQAAPDGSLRLAYMER